MPVGEIAALADRQCQHAIPIGAADQFGVSVIGKLRAGIAGGAPHHLAIAATDDDVGEHRGQYRSLRHRQKMPLSLGAGDIEQGPFVEHRRTTQQRSGHQDLGLARQLTDQRTRRIDEHRQALGEFGSLLELGMWNKVGQKPVEEVDMSRPQLRRILQKEIGDTPRSLGAALGITISDDFIQPWDQRGGGYHRPCSKRNPDCAIPSRHPVQRD